MVHEDFKTDSDDYDEWPGDFYIPAESENP